MAYQLIYTSAPRGLLSGRTGFVTVARHREIGERLAGELEKDSHYERPESLGVLPVIRNFGFYQQGGEEFWVLSRIQESGLDYTKRPCHLAHHLVGTRREVLSGSPLQWLRGWPGFCEQWQEEPRWLGKEEEVQMAGEKSFFPRTSGLPEGLPGGEEFWRKLASSASARPIFIYRPDQESLLLDAWQWALSQVSEPRQWRISWTSFLRTGESARRYHWVAGYPQTAAAILARVEPQRVVDLTEGTINPGLMRQVCQGEISPGKTRKAPVYQDSSGEPAPVRKVVRPGVGSGQPESFPERPAVVFTPDSPSERDEGSASWKNYCWIIGGVLLILGAVIGWGRFSGKEEGQPEPVINPVQWEPVIVIPSTEPVADTPKVKPEPLLELGSTVSGEEYREQWQAIRERGDPQEISRFIVQLKRDKVDEEWLAQVEQQFQDQVRRAEQQRIHEFFPATPVRFLTGRLNEWEITVRWPEDIDLAETSWRVISPARFPSEGEELARLQLVRTSARYPVFQVAYDIFSVLGVEERWREGKRLLVFRSETLSSEIFQLNRQLLVLQRTHGYQVYDSAGNPLLVIWKAHRAADLEVQPVPEITLATWLSEESGKLALQEWTIPLMERFCAEIPENWHFHNPQGVRLMVEREATGAFYLKPAIEKREHALESGSRIQQDPQWFRSDLPWMQQNGPWRLALEIPETNETLNLLILK